MLITPPPPQHRRDGRQGRRQATCQITSKIPRHLTAKVTPKSPVRVPGGVAKRSIYNTGNAPRISPDRRSCTPAGLHKTVRAEMTVPEVVDRPSGSAAVRTRREGGGQLPGYPEPGSCWAHSFGGSGGPRASFGRRRNSFAGPMPAKARDRSFRAWQKDVTGGFVLGASQERGDRDELVLAPRCVRGH